MVEVVSLIPNGVDPHTYEPSAGDIRLLERASVFVTIGLEFEQMEHRLLHSVDGDMLIVVNAAARVPLAESGADDEDEDGDDREHDHQIDSHIWLSPINAQTMVANIAEGMIAAHTEHADAYAANARRYIERLERLDDEFRQRLGDCQREIIIAPHNAYSYLGNEYGFGVVSIYGLEPEAEASSDEIIAVIDSARQNDIKHIFYEEAVDARVPQVIATEVGATLLQLHPLEYAPIGTGQLPCADGGQYA